MKHDDFMRRAIDLATNSVHQGGGPFGAIIVLNGQIISEGTNRVVLDKDPSAHAEMVALRRACQALGSHILGDADIYTSCEPCPMCLGAIWWARARSIYFGNSRAEAAAIGFDDAAIYDEVSRPLKERQLPIKRLLKKEASASFAAWQQKTDKVRY